MNEERKAFLLWQEGFLFFSIRTVQGTIESRERYGKRDTTLVSENISVLVVDDEDRIRRLLKMYLRT